MTVSVNRVTLIGNLGKDPEMGYLPSGTTVVNLMVATSEGWKDRHTGKQQERTEWHKVALFGKLAEIAGERLKKSNQVYVEGRLHTRRWQDAEGVERYLTEIIAEKMQVLDTRNGNNYQIAQNDKVEYGAASPATKQTARTVGLDMALQGVSSE